MSDVNLYKCPNCGGDLSWETEHSAFACPYCGGNFDKSQMEGLASGQGGDPVLDDKMRSDMEKYARDAGLEDEFEKGNALYECPTCGASVITEKESAAAKCFYCHSNIVMKGRLEGKYRPSRIIPFKTNKQQAIDALSSYCAKKKFLPKGFATPEYFDEVSAVYVPYWTVNAMVGGNIRGQGKNIKVYTRGEYQITETSHYEWSRDAKMRFDRIPADASKRADDTLMQNIEPFDYSGEEDFSLSYLSGYQAERFSVGQDEVFPDMQKKAVRSATDVVMQDVHYQSVSVSGNSMSIRRTLWFLTLYPVWFLTYPYRDKVYSFAMNGQTGKFAGNLPIDKKAIDTLGIIMSMAGAAVGLLVWLYLVFWVYRGI